MRIGATYDMMRIKNYCHKLMFFRKRFPRQKKASQQINNNNNNNTIQ